MKRLPLFRRILIDIDGVLADWMTAAADVAEERWRLRLHNVCNPSFDLTKEWRLTPKQDRILRTDPEVILMAPLRPHALEVMQALRAIRGNVLHIVTSRPNIPTVVHATCEWLDRYNIPYDAITFTRNKVALVRDTHFHAAIEDNPYIIEDIAAYVKIVFLVIHEHNKTYKPISPNIYRVVDLMDIIERLGG